MDAFLVDHAAAERKASASALSFVVRYPDRREILEPLIELAREELEHFHQVYRLIEARGVLLPPDEKDPYIGGLTRWVRSRGEERFLDRLVLGAVVEARGCERFGLIADALPQGELKTFYEDITRSEARHAGLFTRLARVYFQAEEVDRRVESLLDFEGEVVRGLELRAALH
jgi:tRNA-(ms[2]io[6]A)-hydroxylase